MAKYRTLVLRFLALLAPFIPAVASLLLELVGVAAIVWGCALIAPFLGFIVGGVGLILVGLAVDPPRRAKRIPTPKAETI